MLDNIEELPPDIGETETETGKRASPDRSTIAFPYTHLEDATNVARSIYESGVDLSRDQVAGMLNLQPTSGGFSLKINAARMFGLVELVDGKYHVSTLGEQALSTDENEAKAAKREAFLKVELYQKAFETYRNRPLPSRPHRLEDAFVIFGVAPKQKDKARLAFERSAQFAGFFHAGKERLVEPILSGAAPANHRQAEQPQAFVVTETAIAETLPKAAQQPLIKGLLDRLPTPDTVWSLGERTRWLRALAVNLAMIYGEKEELDIIIQAPSSTSKAASIIAKAATLQAAPAPKSAAPPSAQAAAAGGDLDDEIPF